MTTLNQFSSLSSRYQIYTILQKMETKTICEVGVDHGWNLTNLCKCKPDLAIAIDIWDSTPYYDFYNKEFHERNYREIIRRSLEENRCILPIRMDSLKAAQCFPDEYFDFIYIDASHDYESVKNNIEAYWTKLKPGCFMAGHDYMDGERIIAAEKLRLQGEALRLQFGVKSAVDEFAKSHNSDVAVILDENGINSWVIQKIVQ
jgi:hypothetical protein